MKVKPKITAWIICDPLNKPRSYTLALTRSRAWENGGQTCIGASDYHAGRWKSRMYSRGWRARKVAVTLKEANV